MNGQTLEREIRSFLVDTYGATSISVVPGGKHPKIVFDYAGKHWSRGFACSPSDENAAKAACRDIAKMLGIPPKQPGKMPRTLDDITRDLAHRAPLLPLDAPPLRAPGRMSLRKASRGDAVRLLVYAPQECVERAGLIASHLKMIFTCDGPVVERAPTGPTFRKNGTLLEAAFQGDGFPAISDRLFNSSAVELLAMGDRIGIIADPAKFDYDQEKEEPTMLDTKQQRSPRTYAREDVSLLDAIRERVGMRSGEFSMALGYGESSFSGWMSEGQCPKVALLAAEALDRRQQDAQPRPAEQTLPDRRYMMTVSATGGIVSTTEIPAHLEEMTLAGKRYFLLPAGDK